MAMSQTPPSSTPRVRRARRPHGDEEGAVEEGDATLGGRLVGAHHDLGLEIVNDHELPERAPVGSVGRFYLKQRVRHASDRRKGSSWFVDNPRVNRDSIVAQLNMDMVGRGPDSLRGAPRTIQIIGSRRQDFERREE